MHKIEHEFQDMMVAPRSTVFFDFAESKPKKNIHLMKSKSKSNKKFELDFNFQSDKFIPNVEFLCSLIDHSRDNESHQRQLAHLKHIKRSNKTDKIVGCWKIGETLGKGHFSNVVKGSDLIYNDSTVALKYIVIEKGKEKQMQVLVSSEIKCLTKIQNFDHVVQLLGYNLNDSLVDKRTSESVNVVLFALQYASNGNLHDFVYQYGPLPNTIARTFFRQIMEGLNACHSVGVIHRDIKSQNIVLDSHFNVKICDFGLAKVTPVLKKYTVSTQYHTSHTIHNTILRQQRAKI